ncbi:MAG: ribonuclease E activity regulator RraA [Gammaproteobacteria bacterium]|nr:ribonuclease E activity regulator RraA [Gammaproteobacteria bacterium]
MSIKTADLCDEFDDQIQVAQPLFLDYGGRIMFQGPIHTLKIFEDNSLVRSTLEQPGQSKVLVIDGGASMRCALVGGNLAVLAAKNGWAGIIVNGCIRDSEEIAAQPVGVKALATNPRKSVKKGVGDDNITVRFADVTFSPNHYVYADEDGIVVAEQALT